MDYELIYQNIAASVRKLTLEEDLAKEETQEVFLKMIPLVH